MIDLSAFKVNISTFMITPFVKMREEYPNVKKYGKYIEELRRELYKPQPMDQVLQPYGNMIPVSAFSFMHMYMYCKNFPAPAMSAVFSATFRQHHQHFCNFQLSSFVERCLVSPNCSTSDRPISGCVFKSWCWAPVMAMKCDRHLFLQWSLETGEMLPLIQKWMKKTRSGNQSSKKICPRIDFGFANSLPCDCEFFQQLLISLSK